MQTLHYSERQPAPSYFVSRVIVETLKQTSGDQVVSVSQIADQAKTTAEQVASILAPMLQLEDASGMRLSNSARFKLAFEAARHGALQQVARALSWQEFEAFTEECLQIGGFATQKGIVLRDDSRRWQIDVVAKKGPIILVIDCKHWETPGYGSKVKKAAEHQKQAAQALIKRMRTRGEVGSERLLALPMILTLFEPRERLADGVAVVSVEQLADFLEGMSPFASELPFIPI